MNDIAIISLSESAEINSFVKVACLPTEKDANEFPEFNQDCYASGNLLKKII